MLYLCTRKQGTTHSSLHRGVEQLVARQAHNLEVVRSSRASATTNRASATNKRQMWSTIAVMRLYSFAFSPPFEKNGRTKVRQCITGVFQNHWAFLVAKNVKKMCTSATRKKPSVRRSSLHSSPPTNNLFAYISCSVVLRAKNGFFSLPTSTYRSLISAVPIQRVCFTDCARESTSL